MYIYNRLILYIIMNVLILLTLVSAVPWCVLARLWTIII